MRYKNIGQWWNSKEIDLVDIGGVVYALNKWNGESFLDCWECTGEQLMDAGDRRYTIKPLYDSVTFDISGYIVE